MRLRAYGYAWVTVGLFAFSLAGHWLFGWFAFVAEQQQHASPVVVADYVVEMARDTFENWQSEFLQLLWQVVGLAYFLYHRLHPRIIEVGLHPDGSLRDRHLWKLPPLAPRLYALRMDAELDFASATDMERAIAEHLALHPEVRDICLFAHPINRIDATGVEMFGQLRKTLQQRNITLHISGIKLPVERVLERAGALQDSPLLKMYRTDAEALQAFERLGAAP